MGKTGVLCGAMAVYCVYSQTCGVLFALTNVRELGHAKRYMTHDLRWYKGCNFEIHFQNYAQAFWKHCRRTNF